MRKENNNSIQEILERLERLENAVFETASKKVAKKGTDEFGGAIGGVRFLNSRGFFSKKRTLRDIREELSKHDYHYSAQAVQTSINRLSVVGGPLVSFREAGKKVYAERK